MENIEQGIWFIYDGECALCSKAATALRIKEKYGQLNLLDARSNPNHQLLTMINKQQLDLDEGMVIYHQGEFFHGVTALQFMARFGSPNGWFNWMNKSLFWSESLARLMYPWMRGIRNHLVRRKKITRIDNLNRSHHSVFETVFADNWDLLPVVLKKHYQPTAYNEETITFQGKMDINSRGPIKWMSPLLWLVRGIPPKSEKDIPVEVSFVSLKDELALKFDRTFSFKNSKPYRFDSSLYPQGAGKVFEVMKFGLTWKMNICWDFDRIKIEHDGYALNWFGHFIPIPLAWLFGKAIAEEIAVDDNCFDMSVKINHPLWGVIYSYQGRFSSKDQ